MTTDRRIFAKIVSGGQTGADQGALDNDAVYTFAWLHYAQATVGYRF